MDFLSNPRRPMKKKIFTVSLPRRSSILSDRPTWASIVFEWRYRGVARSKTKLRILHHQGDDSQKPRRVKFAIERAVFGPSALETLVVCKEIWRRKRLANSGENGYMHIEIINRRFPAYHTNGVCRQLCLEDFSWQARAKIKAVRYARQRIRTVYIASLDRGCNRSRAGSVALLPPSPSRPPTAAAPTPATATAATTTTQTQPPWWSLPRSKSQAVTNIQWISNSPNSPGYPRDRIRNMTKHHD